MTDAWAALRVGDTFVKRRADGTLDTYTVEGWTPRGKLLVRRPSGTLASYWWHWASDVPKGYEVWRGEERIS